MHQVPQYDRAAKVPWQIGLQKVKRMKRAASMWARNVNVAAVRNGRKQKRIRLLFKIGMTSMILQDLIVMKSTRIVTRRYQRCEIGRTDFMHTVWLGAIAAILMILKKFTNQHSRVGTSTEIASGC